MTYFADWKIHVSVYPIPMGEEAFKKEIAEYVDGKGMLEFALSQPIPFKLISKVANLHVKRIKGE